MSKFEWTAVGADGMTVIGGEGSLDGAGMRRCLLSRELHPVRVVEKKSILQLEIGRKRVPRRDLMHLSRQLAVFVRAGISILDALEVIAEEAPNKLLRK